MASDVVTNGVTTDLMINDWRFPNNCESTLLAELDITSAWQGGYCASVTVNNNGDTTIDDWRVEVDLNGAFVSNEWSADFSFEGDIMIADAPIWSAAIQPGDNTAFGFCANTDTGTLPTVVSVQ